MYFYIDGMWTRAEDPRNRTLSDLHAFQYPPSGRTGTPSNSYLVCAAAFGCLLYRTCDSARRSLIRLSRHTRHTKLDMSWCGISTCILTLKPAMQQAGLMTGSCTGASRSVMECICASKDSGKPTSPTGHWEVQTYTHHKEWLLCPIFWLALWMVVKYEAPGWKVSLH